MSDQKKKLTTASGRPYAENENSLTAGARGHVLLQDVILHEKMAHFNRERIPERVVHAKGSGAYGTFTVTNDITHLTKALIFSEIGKKTRTFLRFSTVGGEKGSADTERDPRGFAIKFYTEDGNWDIVGNNTPVFFIKDAKKFGDFIHTQKRDPRTNCKSATMMWDFWSLNPESLHQIMILFSDRGTPYSYRHLHGFGSHTFSLVNHNNDVVYTKFHFKTKQGIKNFTAEEADRMKGMDADWAQRDLVDAIDRGDYPKWTLHIQVMTPEQAKNFRWNPFDVTKTWPQAEFPLIEVGELELNEIPDNYFAHVEQSAFSPSRIVNGIGFSPDKMLQGRMLSYPDAQRYRMGINFEQLPVNRCPYATNNYHRDGAMRYDDNGGSSANYFPNSFDQIEADQSYKEPAFELDNIMADWYDRNGINDDDHYTQPGILFDQVMTEEEKNNTVANFVGSLKMVSGPKRELIINRQLCHFFRTSVDLGMRIAKSLGVEIDPQKLNLHR